MKSTIRFGHWLPLAAIATALMIGNSILPAAAAGQTPWFNRDQPSGVGDFEDTVNLLKIKCRFKAGGGAVTPGGGYHCEVPKGGWCVNSETTPKGACKDIEVQYSWAAGNGWTAGSTPWLNRDLPSGVGDFEDTVNLLTVKCRFKAGGGAVTTGGGYHCQSPTGGWCVNSETTPKGTCKDIEVQYSWQ